MLERCNAARLSLVPRNAACGRASPSTGMLCAARLCSLAGAALLQRCPGVLWLVGTARARPQGSGVVLFWQRCFPEPGWACLARCVSSLPPSRARVLLTGWSCPMHPEFGDLWMLHACHGVCSRRVSPWAARPRDGQMLHCPHSWAQPSSHSRQHQLVAAGTGCLSFSSLVALEKVFQRLKQCEDRHLHIWKCVTNEIRIWEGFCRNSSLLYLLHSKP